MFSILSAIFFACDQGNDATTAKSEPTTQKIAPTPSPTTSGSSGTVSDDTVVVTWEGGSLSYATTKKIKNIAHENITRDKFSSREVRRSRVTAPLS